MDIVFIVPHNLSLIPQSDLSLLRWLIQKDSLKQDVFLIGNAGSRRRHLVMQFLVNNIVIHVPIY